MPFPAHQSHHRPLISLISLCFLRSLLQERQRQLSHHLHSIIHPPFDHFDSFFYICFDYVFRLCMSFMKSHAFGFIYTGIICITCFHFVLTWIKVIQIYHFFLSLLALFYSYFLYSYLLLFLKHVVSPINTRNWYWLLLKTCYFVACN